MGRRPHIYVMRRKYARSPESPNATVPAITAEIRLFWPPGQLDGAYELLAEAYVQAVAELGLKG